MLLCIGWPKFLLSAVHLVDNGTVVISSYAPSVSHLPDNNTVQISGFYPFDDTIIISVSTDTELALRVPCFSTGASVTSADGTELQAASCAFFAINVSAGDSINMTLKNDIQIFEWVANRTDGSCKYCACLLSQLS